MFSLYYGFPIEVVEQILYYVVAFETREFPMNENVKPSWDKLQEHCVRMKNFHTRKLNTFWKNMFRVMFVDFQECEHSEQYEHEVL